MINSIRLENFQSHKDTTIDFVAGTNALIGQSRSGKTAVLRALKKIRTNKPPGNAFQSWDGGETKITVALKEGTEILWGMDAKGAYYKMWTPLDDGTVKEDEFRAMGQGVPDEITAAFNMAAGNVQEQLDPIFMLSLQSGEVATELNKAVRLDVIGKATSEIRKQKLDADAEHKRGKAEVERLEKKLKGFDHLEGIDEAIKLIETADLDREGKSAKVKAIRAASGQISGLVATIKNANKILKATTGVKAVERLFKELDNIGRRSHALETLIYNAVNEKYVVDAVKGKAGLAKQLPGVITLTEKLKGKIGEKANIGGLVCRAVSVTKKFNIEYAAQIENQEIFNRLMPDVCPLCGAGHKEEEHL